MQRSTLLRENTGGSDAVSPVELLFDLVFVFAATRLSLFLVEHLSWGGALQAAILLLAVWWFWDHMVWVMNWFDPNSWLVRWMLFVVMLLGLVMSTSVPRAFDDLAIPFVVGYLGMHAVRGLFVILGAWHEDRELALNIARASIWAALASPLWIIGAMADPTTRTWWWIGAIAIDYGAPLLRYRLPGLAASPVDTWDVSGPHLAERARLFVIIALGESVIVMGTTFDGRWSETAAPFALLGAFATTVLLWILYFNHTAENAEAYISASDDSGKVAVDSFGYRHLLIIAGIITAAVGNELVLAHPEDAVDAPTAIVLFGGVALYVLGTLLFKRSIGYRWLRSHIFAIVALAALLAVALSPVGTVLPLIACAWLANAVLLAVVIADEVVHRRGTTDDPEHDDPAHDDRVHNDPAHDER